MAVLNREKIAVNGPWHDYLATCVHSGALSMKAHSAVTYPPRRLTGLRFLTPGELWTLLKNAYKLLRSNDPLLLFSSTAFFTTFALPPILIILTDILKLFFTELRVREELF